MPAGADGCGGRTLPFEPRSAEGNASPAGPVGGCRAPVIPNRARLAVRGEGAVARFPGEGYVSAMDSAETVRLTSLSHGAG